MYTPQKKLFVTLSAVAILSYGIFNSLQFPTRLNPNPSISAEQEAGADGLGILMNPRRASPEQKLKVAGNAPCNPEREVCNR